MKVGIIQSNYLPWRGYFDFIKEVDLFVFHDDIQYTKNDWRNRNRIKTSKGTLWLTVPVHHKYQSQKIYHTEIDYSQNWQKKHINLLDEWYKKTPYYSNYREELLQLLELKYPSISTLNIALINWILGILNINTKCVLSSDYNTSGIKTERLIFLLKKLNATEYLSGPSAKAYLDTQMFFKHNIKLIYKEYKYKNYPQLWGDFVDGLSILDLLFNVGENSKEFLSENK